MDNAIYKKKQGLRVRLARRIANMTQQELADKMTAELGTHWGDEAKVSRIEHGQDITSLELAALSVVLGQPIPWLMGVDDDGMQAPIIHAPSGRPAWFRRPIDINAAEASLSQLAA